MKRIALLLTLVMVLVLLAACGAKTYTVNFVVNGETVSSEKYEEGATPVAPTVEGYVENGTAYTFTGWDAEIVPVTGEVTYTAVFSSALVQYDVTFIYGGNTTGTPVKVEHGTVPTAPTDGLNYETAEKVFTFTGWDKEIAPASGDVTYTAVYSETAREYDVTFVYGGKPGTPVKVAYGTTPTAPTTGLDYQTDEQVFTFTGWDKTIAAVSGDVTYTAVYSSTARLYNVTFIYGGNTTGTPVQVAYGSTPTAPTEGLDYMTAEKVYTFSAWDKTIEIVTGDATYTAVYTDAAREYDVTFIYGGNTTGTPVKVAYGTLPTAPTENLGYMTETKVFTFSAWDKEIVAVTGDVTYTALFTETDRLYTITLVYDGKTETLSLAYGATFTLPTPEASYSKDGADYTYNGSWDKEAVAVTADATYTAQYTLTRKVIYSENFDARDAVEVSDSNLVLNGWTLTMAGKAGSYAKILVDPENPANKYLLFHADPNNDAVQAGNKGPDGKGLSSMKGLTKMTITIDLGKLNDTDLTNSYIRFRSGSKYVKFLTTNQADGSITFCGTKLTDAEGSLITLSEDLKTFKMDFDFVSATASISVDGVTLVENASLYDSWTTWKSTHAEDMLTYIDSCTAYVYQWALETKTVETSLLVDNFSIVAYN